MRGWLEEPGRVLSPSAVAMRYALIVATITAIELGYEQGITVAIAILAYNQFTHVHMLDRIQATLDARIDPEDPRPTKLTEGWMELDGRLLGINPLTFRAMLIVVSIVVILLGAPKTGGFAALFVLYSGTESTGVLFGKVVDNLVQIEVVRRVAIKLGGAIPIGWGRGDEKRG